MAAQHKYSKKCTFHLHESVLEGNFLYLEELLQAGEFEDIEQLVLITLDVWPALFKHFVRWLYTGAVTDDVFVERTADLWNLAGSSSLSAPAFMKYLIDKAEKLFTAAHYLRLLQDLQDLAMDQFAEPQLERYIFAKDGLQDRDRRLE